MIYTTVITDRDPTQSGWHEFIQFQDVNRLDAESTARHYAKVYQGFASVYLENGESIYEVDGGVE